MEVTTESEDSIETIQHKRPSGWDLQTNANPSNLRHSYAGGSNADADNETNFG